MHVAVTGPLFSNYVISGAGEPTSGGLLPIYKTSQLHSVELRSSQATIYFPLDQLNARTSDIYVESPNPSVSGVNVM